MKYSYVKLTDKGLSGRTLYWEGYGEPDQTAIDTLKLTNPLSGYNGEHLGWQTTLQVMGELGFDLVAVVPQKHMKSLEGFKIWNSYIFKKAESAGEEK